MIETYRRLEAAEIIELDGDTLILNEDTLAVTKLNEAGGWIWQSLAEDITVEELATRMTEVYSVDRTRASEDLKGFLSRMVDMGLVVRA
ncbi:PqqD family protein [Cohnella sp.]|uniref:PqqD family protein n=1 Tax=Cohnella sp. TaxID=1883426 RepID=UPI003569F33B